jgi:hypothetical protein
MYHATRTMRRRTALVTAAVAMAMLHAPAGRWRRAARAAEATWEPRQPAADDRRRVLAGETVAVTVAERTDRDLASGVVGYLPLPVARVGEYLAAAELAVQDPGITAWAAVRDGASPEVLGRLRLGVTETEELLESRPGSVWNLSNAEAEGLRALRPALGGPARAGLAQATISAQYRTLLLRRAEAYRAGGLAAIEPYVRRGGVIDPAAELRAAVEDVRPLAGASPALPEALLNYPALQHVARPSRIYWVERRLQGRITPSLIHQLVEVRPELALHVERHFFVGHSYTSSQTLTAAVPWGSGALLFVVSRVFTDLVTGLGGDLKRGVGRRQLRSDLAGRLERIRAALTKPTPPQSP